MNAYADIDEGLDTFNDEQDRAEAEREFRENPHLVTFMYGDDSELTFTATEVETLDLRGERKPGTEIRKLGSPAPSIFDFSEGSLVASGIVTLGEDLELGEFTKELRWTDFGNERQVAHR